MTNNGSLGRTMLPEDRTLILVDDDRIFSERLARALSTRGFDVVNYNSAEDAINRIHNQPPAFAVVDLRLGNGNGLGVIIELSSLRPTARAVVLTAYDSLATAVLAIKLGAVDYMAKPVDIDAVTEALLGHREIRPQLPPDPMSATRIRWEHVQRIYELCDRNISETARRLKMHRRSLQRILSKYAPRE